MKITSIDLIAEIERLAAACPWDRVNLWLTREPEGQYSFTAYIPQNEKFGFESRFGNGETPAAAVDEAIQHCANRDPEIARKIRVEKIQSEIEQLQAVIIGLPPYRPNRELANGEPAIIVPDPVVEV